MPSVLLLPYFSIIFPTADVLRLTPEWCNCFVWENEPNIPSPPRPGRAQLTPRPSDAGGVRDQRRRDFIEVNNVATAAAVGPATSSGVSPTPVKPRPTASWIPPEAPTEFSSLPQPVRDAAQMYFNATSGLTVMKGVEFGETHYDLEDWKNRKKVEMTFDPNARQER